MDGIQVFAWFLAGTTLPIVVGGAIGSVATLVRQNSSRGNRH